MLKKFYEFYAMESPITIIISTQNFKISLEEVFIEGIIQEGKIVRLELNNDSYLDLTPDKYTLIESDLGLKYIDGENYVIIC